MFSYLKIVLKGFLKFRKKRKNLTLVLAGAFFLIFFIISLFNTVFSNIEDYWGKMLLGEGTIVAKDYKDYKILKPPKKEYYFSSEEINESLKKIKGVNFSRRFRLFALVEGYKSKRRQPMVLIGTSAEKEQSIIPNVKLSEGRFPKDGRNEICLFLESAGQLAVDVGDTVIVYTQNVDGYMDCDILRVVGIVEPRKVQYFFDSDIVGFVPSSFATSIKGVDKNYASEIVFSTNSFLKRIMLKYLIPKSFKVVSMWRSSEVTLTMRWVYNFIRWILILLIIGIVFSSVYHNVYLMIIERYKEIGVYLTFGASRKWILKVLLGELTFYTLYCSIIGAIFSTLLILGINSMEIYATNAQMEVFICASQFSIHLRPEYYLYSFLLLWFIVLAAGVYPILKGISEGIIVKLFRR